jgi:hypothetical protein
MPRPDSDAESHGCGRMSPHAEQQSMFTRGSSESRELLSGYGIRSVANMFKQFSKSFIMREVVTYSRGKFGVLI